MANIITRFDPFGGSLDELFKGFFLRPVKFDVDGGTPLQIRMDVTQDEKAYMVKAELPGVKKEDIRVSIDGNQVSISAEVKRETEEKKGEEVVRSERYYGQVYRGFTLEAEVDEAKAEAKYADGILNLTLPKKAPAQSKRLTIN